MAFDIHAPVFEPESGERDEEQAIAYMDGLVDLFEASPEAQALHEAGVETGWTGMFLDYAINYVGATPPDMTVSDLHEVLFELFPQKVSADAEEAPAIVTELRAFWQFLKREYQLPNADGLLSELGSPAERKLTARMSNPDNFGMAKSMVMMGKARGFDTTTQEGLEQWMTVYNSELGAPPPLDASTLDDDLSPPPAPRAGGRTKASRAKNKRKMEKASRKANRRRR
jgi:hypothetical protein